MKVDKMRKITKRLFKSYGTEIVSLKASVDKLEVVTRTPSPTSRRLRYLERLIGADKAKTKVELSMVGTTDLYKLTLEE